MAHYKMPALEETGFAILRRREVPSSEEWLGLDWVDWKSSGETRFAPIASAEGELECAGFWDVGKPDKGGVWTSNAPKAPTLVNYVEKVGADFGRCRIIELQPNTYEEAIHNLHQDDNNRLNPDDTGWVVRAWVELTDSSDSYMIVREDKDDPSTESRIRLPQGAQFVVDSQRLWHAVWHPGPGPRYALITSFESGPELEAFIASEQPE
jgi:hypothetical protein